MSHFRIPQQLFDLINFLKSLVNLKDQLRSVTQLHLFGNLLAQIVGRQLQTADNFLQMSIVQRHQINRRIFQIRRHRHFGNRHNRVNSLQITNFPFLNKSGQNPFDFLPDPQLSAAMTRMEKAGRSIVEVVEANPAKAKQVRRFANYYLPDAVNVLEQYAKLARQGVRGENAASIRAEVERNAASIATAFENQLDALYAAESMDLSADLTVLQNMLKGQGLG